MADEVTGDPLGAIPPARRFDLKDLRPLARLRDGDGGQVGLSDDALFVACGDGPAVRVGYDSMAEVAVQSVDYFLSVMAVVIVGFGLYTVQTSVPGGLGLAAIGLVSGYRTYRRRAALVVRVTGRAKPLTLHPTDTDALYDALADRAVADAD